MSYFEDHESQAAILFIMVTVMFILGILFGGAFAIKGFNRSQRLADARNQVAINEIQIKQTAQLVEVQKQKADIKIEEAKGIAEAQRLINGTLTDKYLQHEAIQAQETQSNKIIYIPSGNQGIPFVNNVNQ